MKKDSIYSPNCKNKFSFVNTNSSLNQNEVETSHRLYTHQKIMNKKAERREKSPRTGLRLWLGGEKRFILPPKATFCSLSRDQCCSINCASLYRVNVMKKDSIYSPNCKNKFSFVNTKPSLNQNEVKTTYRPHTHQHIMNKKAEREKNHLVLNLGCDWWGNNYLFYHQRRHSVALTWSTS